MLKANFLNTLKDQHASQLRFLAFFKSSLSLNIIIKDTNNN